MEFLSFSHFCGGGGWSLGAVAAGVRSLGGIEFKKGIAELYEKNLSDVIVGDIADVSLMQVKNLMPISRRKDQILIMQTSPPCQEYSNANRNKDLCSDRALILRKTWKYYAFFKPEYVVLENVPAYRSAPVYLEFKDFLKSLGYTISFDEVVNCADYGVPQTRKRLIMIACKDEYPEIKLKPTHSKEEWVGWYGAIEDLLDALPESRLTERQKLSLERYVGKNALVACDNSGGSGGSYKTRTEDEPVFTISASWGQHRSEPKALLIERFGNIKVRNDKSPAWTIKAGLADDGKGGTRTQLIDAYLESGAKVVSLNTRALARLQSFPDSYEFSGKPSLDVRVIGNSVPPRLAEEICLQIKREVCAWDFGQECAESRHVLSAA